jgi:phosphatidylserine decarboxylase
MRPVPRPKESRPRLGERFLAIVQHILPQRSLTRVVYTATRWRWPPWKNALIRWFVQHYQVDLSEAEHPSLKDHPHFNSFFTRALRPGARPLPTAPHAVSCPIDGHVSQVGIVQGGRMIQAKGKHFDLPTLLGGDHELAAQLDDGPFATLYLSPRDYHRIHMPLRGRLRAMTYIPGKLFAVSPLSVRTIPGVFARNERLATVFDTNAGTMVLVLIGALFVGCTETVWSGSLVSVRHRKIRRWDYRHGQGLTLDRGVEVGRFNMGSTVILLFAKDRVNWAECLRPGVNVRMGEIIGEERCGG